MPPLRFLSPLHKASRQIRVYLHEAMEDLDLHKDSEGHALAYLLSYGPCPVSEVSRVFGLRASTLTSLLDRLERRNLLRRLPNPEDRRSFLVQLTAEGKRKARRVRRIVEELEERIGHDLRAQDLQGFNAVMEAIGHVTRVTLRTP